MFRVIVVFLLWLLTLGIFSVKISWVDGVNVSLTGWPDALLGLIRNRKV